MMTLLTITVTMTLKICFKNSKINL